MSWYKCHYCFQIFNSDFDPDCFQPDPRHSLKGYPDIVICEACREKEQDDADYRASISPPGETK